MHHRSVTSVTDEDVLNIYTDGSSLGRPRVGGIGIRFVQIDSSGEEQVCDIEMPGFRNATNNQMELYACITALKEAIKLEVPPTVRKIVVHTDSQYVVNNYKSAMFKWPKTRWRTRHGRPILNAELWKDLVRCIKMYHNTGRRVEFLWVRGHAKSIHNKAVDRLARKSARDALNKPLSVVHVRRKLTPKSVEIGSVPMLGQKMSIRIITTEYLKVQRMWKCKYEVVSKRSRFRGNVDIIFSDSDTLLKAGHTYYVKVNSDSANPTIERVFREIAAKRKAG